MFNRYFSVIGFSLILLFLGCAELQQFEGQIPKPEATLDRVEVDHISLHDVTLVFYLNIKNPYPLKLKLDGVDLDFSIEGTRFLKTQMAGGLEIPAKQVKNSSFAVTLAYQDIIKIVKDIGNRELLKCTIDAAVKIPLPKISGLPPNMTFQYKLEKEIPAIMPDVRLQNFQVMMPTVQDLQKDMTRSASAYTPEKVHDIFKSIFNGEGSKAIPAELKNLDIKFDVSFDILLQNKTRFVPDFKSVNYDFAVNDQNLVSGNTDKITRKGDTTILSIRNSFSSRQLSEGIVASFRSGQGTFNLKGSTAIRLPPSVSSKNTELNFAESGKFNLR